MRKFTLRKKERMCSRNNIETLFTGGNSSFSVFPLRAVYRKSECEDVRVEILVSVAKRHLRHAVDRNRVKRQIREAYRKNKYILDVALETKSDSPYKENLSNEEKGVSCFSVAFIWLADELFPSSVVESKVKNLLTRISEKL